MFIAGKKQHLNLLRIVMGSKWFRNEISDLKQIILEKHQHSQKAESALEIITAKIKIKPTFIQYCKTFNCILKVVISSHSLRKKKISKTRKVSRK